jgi:RNA polymerase sigma factor (sigma-70 family)
MANGNRNGAVRRLSRVALRRDGEGLTDAELLECYLTGRDEEAFELLLQRHGPMVLGVCRRVLRNDADAHDAFQATFLVFVRKVASIGHRQMVGNWLYGVAHKTALKAKALDRRRRAKEMQAGTQPRAVPPDDAIQELLASLDTALGRLPDKYRTPIVLCDLEGKPLKEAARRLGCPQGTVASRLARARAMLAKRLPRCGLVSVGALVTAQGTASASVPSALAVSTVQAARAVAAGQATATGMISAKVVALTEGVVKAMWMTKVKTLTAVLMAVTLVVVGGSLLVYRALGSERGQSAAASKDEKAKSDKESLQGAWVAVSAERNGEKFSEERLKRWEQLVFAADKVSRKGSAPVEGAYTIDSDKKPKEIDLFTDGDGWTGIYELKGTSLKVALRCGEERPTSFDSKDSLVIVFEKKKK